MAAAYANQRSVQAPTFADQQAIVQATYVARLQRRTMPPRCNPFTILLLVLAIGMMFIGVTMTLIANWPGATSIGDNPLRIAGPVLLAVGGALCLLAIVLVCMLSNREREKWDRNLGEMVTKRLQSSGDRGPLISDDSSGVKTGQSAPDTDQNKYSMIKPSNYGYSQGPHVSELPDPTRGVPNGRTGSVGSADGSDPNSVPTPLRVTRKRRQQPKGDVSGSSAGTNQSFTVSIGEADLGLPGMTSSQRASSIPPGGGQQVYANLSYERDTPEMNRGRTGGQPLPSGNRRRGTDGNGRPHSSSVDPIRDPVMRNIALQQRALKVHIKAQPGTAVHITPTPTPPRGGRSAARHPRGSANDSETEI